MILVQEVVCSWIYKAHVHILQFDIILVIVFSGKEKLY